ncbi:hypothetical protein SGPA1_10104 [Streptomyces misionensis JCM 4497]
MVLPKCSTVLSPGRSGVHAARKASVYMRGGRSIATDRGPANIGFRPPPSGRFRPGPPGELRHIRRRKVSSFVALTSFIALAAQSRPLVRVGLGIVVCLMR